MSCVAVSLLLCLLGGSAAAQTPIAAAPGVPEGLSASDWSGIRQAYETGRYQVFAVDGGHRARNPGQQWTTTFDGRGFTTTPDAGGWSWGLELVAYGWGEAQLEVDTARTGSAVSGRVARRWDDRLIEWYRNDARGLEHGYTVRARPESASGPLALRLEVRGGLVPVVAEDRRDVCFLDAHRERVVSYAGLAVVDAEGKRLVAGWNARAGGLELQVDDEGARYPLTIDPIAQQAYLKASNAETGDQFGYAVAASGDTAVVGARFEDSSATGVNSDQSDNGALSSGAAYVFVRSGPIWSQQAYLKASNTDAGDHFGYSIAVDGDTVVVGARSEDSSATGVDGNESDNSAVDSGAAFVFVRTGSTWSQQAYLKASNTDAGDEFGYSVAVDGNTVVVGARTEDSSATGVDGDQSDDGASGSGAAYVFMRSGSTWSQQAYLKASNTGGSDQFGYSVAVDGDTVVVAAPFEASSATGVDGNQGDDGASGSGGAYVFVRSGSTWSQQAYLKASNTGANDTFGRSVAASGDTVVVGARSEASSATGVDGNQSDNSAFSSGAAYVFVRSGPTWSQQAYLKASNTEAFDSFGESVAVSGDTVVVGARREDSSATGVDGNQDNNGSPGSGAAYVFTRSGSIWSQQTYLKASNAETNDTFGRSVAVSGDTVVVGAHDEDSSATSPNGNQSDNGAFSSGAVYVFVFLPPPFEDLGCDLAGNFAPALAGSGDPSPGGNFTLDLAGMPPSTMGPLLVGVSELKAPFKGGFLVPAPLLSVSLLTLTGSFSLPVTIPASVPSGTGIWLQAWFPDAGAPKGVSSTNGLKINVQ